MAHSSAQSDVQAGQVANAKLSRVSRRTRASIACISCRVRKSRCDVEKSDPCTNCRADNLDCIIAHNGSRRVLRSLRRVEAMKKMNRQIPSDMAVSSAGVNQFEQSNSINGAVSPGVPLVAPTSVPQVVDSLNGRSTPPVDVSWQGQSWNVENYFQYGILPASLSLAELPIPAVDVLSSANCKRHLPEYIEPLPSHLSRDTIEYLSLKGALRVPPDEVRDALFHAYIDYVHPFLPILDLSRLSCLLRTPEANGGNLSLLLLQAIMFAGSSFVDLKLLNIAGFRSRRAAREAFYHGAKLLYEFDVEHDEITSIQALLLMTYWYETPDDQKDMCHWLGAAVSALTKLGLHQAATYINMPVKQGRLCRRIWWSCVMRDAIMALGMKRGTKISRKDYDLPMLALEDFELAELPVALTSLTPECNILTDVRMQLRLAVVCLEKLKLCLILRDVLSVWYTVSKGTQLNSRNGEATKTALILMPITDEVDEARDASCELRLARWVEELPIEAAYNPVLGGEQAHLQSVLDFHRALLRMFYLTTVITFHRPRLNPSISFKGARMRGDIAGVKSIAKQTIRTAATEISKILSELDSLDMLRFLPLTGVTILITAMVGHMLDSCSPHKDIRIASLAHFRSGYRMIQLLRSVYSASDYVTHFIQSVAFGHSDYNHCKQFTRRLAQAIDLEGSFNEKDCEATTIHEGQQETYVDFAHEDWPTTDASLLCNSTWLDATYTSSLYQLQNFDVAGQDHGIGQKKSREYRQEIATDLPLVAAVPSPSSTCSSHQSRNITPSSSSLLEWMQDYLPQV